MAISDRVTTLREDVDRLQRRTVVWSYVPAIVFVIIAGLALFHLSGIGKLIAIRLTPNATVTQEYRPGVSGPATTEVTEVTEVTSVTVAEKAGTDNSNTENSGTDKTGAGSAGSETVSGDAYGWLAVITALVVSVAPVLVLARVVTIAPAGNEGPGATGRSGTGNSGTGNSGAGDSGAGGGSDTTASGTSTTTDGGGAGGGGSTTAPATSQSFVAREPAISTAVATVAVQLLVLFGFGIESGQQATIIAGLAGLSGVLIRTLNSR